MFDMTRILATVGITGNIAAMFSFWLMLVGVALALGFVLGRNRLMNIFMNIYIAFAITVVCPGKFLPHWEFSSATLFLVLLVLISIIDEHLFDIHIPNNAYDVFWRLVVMGMLVVGMSVSIIASLIPKGTILSLPFPYVYEIFAAPLSRLLWLSVPLVILVFINKRLR